MNIAASLPQFRAIQSGLYKHKAKQWPVIPVNRSDLKIEDEWALCEDKTRRFLLYQDEELVILCSDDGLRILSDSKRWQAKGTFDTAPKMFYQLYIIHGLFRLHLIPSAFVLLSGKSENLYIKDGALNISIELKPEVVMTDFELAAINSFKYHFPNVRLKACFFHFGQNLYRKIVNLGLKENYNSDCGLRKWVRKMISLALVTADKVEVTFVELCCDKPDYEAIELFADYILENYIDTETFPKLLWNQFDEDERTNNSVEGYNSKLSNFLKHHPNVWVFIKKIQSEESTATLKFIRIKEGTYISKNRNSKDLQRDLCIQTLKVKYLNKSIDLLSYIEQISESVHDYSKVN